MIYLNLLRRLGRSILLNERVWHADLLNAESSLNLPDAVERYWIASKVYYQHKNLVECLQKLQKMLTDFAAFNFDSYLDHHEKYADEGSLPFDPYAELNYQINNTDWIHALPREIEVYQELLKFIQEHGLRQRAQLDGFRQTFPGLEFHTMVITEDGEATAIPESEVPKEVKAEIEISRRMSEIDIEHCLDSYNDFIKKMNVLITDRGPFAEVLAMFK